MTQPDIIWRDAPQARPCEDCAIAARREWWGFTVDCEPCKARGASRLPQFKEARDRGDWYWHPYRRLLSQLGLEHNQVRAAAQADRVQG